MKRPITTATPPVDFDLRQLEIFKKVVELKSFSKAAAAVFLAQASVSERIANLESSVGTRLLDRLGRQVVPTKAGELLYRHAVRILDMKKAACLEMQEFLGVKRGEIRIGGSTIPGEYILPKVIGRFRQRHPLVTVTLTVGSTKDIETRVLAGELELGVVGSMGADGNLVSRELWKDELVLAVPAGHRWAKKGEIPIQDLYSEPFIVRAPGSGTLQIMEDYLHESGSKGRESLNLVACFGTSSAVKEGVKAGLGVSILSRRAMGTELQTDILRAVRIKDLFMYRRFYLIRDKRKIVSPLCRAMLDFLLSTDENEATELK